MDIADEVKKERLSEVQNTILNTVVLDEMEKIKEIEKNTFSSEKQNTLTKAYKEWTGFSKKKRIAYSVIMMTGVAGFASLTAPISASAAALGMVGVAGNKLIRTGIGMASSVLAGKGFDWLTKSTKENIEKTRKESIENLQTEWNIDDFTEMEKRYKSILNQEKKKEGLLLVGKAVTMGAAGYYGATEGLGMVDDMITGNAPDVSVSNPDVILESDPNYDVAPLMEPVAIEPDVEEVVKETVPIAPASVETSPVEALNPHPIKSGENLWGVLKNKIPEIDGLERAGMKDNAVANLIEKIKENPQEYGITSGDVEDLKIGDEINLEKIQTLLETEKIGADGLIEHAQGLNEEALNRIENYKPETETVISPGAETQLPVDEVAPEPQEQVSDIKQPPTAEEIYAQATEQGEQNLTANLDKIGGQFVKEEWSILKEMPAKEALVGIEDFKEKGFFSKMFSSSENDPLGDWLEETTGENYIGNQSDMAELTNRGQLREYLKQAFETTGEPLKNESIGDYLKRYETNNLASEMRAK